MAINRVGVFIVAAFVLAAVAGVFALKPATSFATPTAGPITGWAWSSNIGWISLNCSDQNVCGTSNYGLTVDTSGVIHGRAWSNNIGWISAESADLSGCPSGTCTAELHHGVMSGWLRALSQDGRGWDGWISLSGSGYGPTVSGGVFSGYSWGSSVVGWMDWSQARTTYDDSCTPAYSCAVDGLTIQHTDINCTVTTVTTCSAPAFCSDGSSVCVYPPLQFSSSGHLRADPSIVPVGNSVTLTWDVQNAQSCNVTGTDGESWSGASTAGTSTNPIEGPTRFTINCTGLDGAQNLSETISVTTVPAFHER